MYIYVTFSHVQTTTIYAPRVQTDDKVKHVLTITTDVVQCVNQSESHRWLMSKCESGELVSVPTAAMPKDKPTLRL